MKNLIKKSLVLASLIILAAYTVSSIISKDWCNTAFTWQLFLLALILSSLQILTNLFKSDYYLLELFVEYIMVVLVVGSFGFLFKWFNFLHLWLVFVYVTPVYIAAYFLDIVRRKQDVDFINEKIKQRKERLNNGQRDNNS
jgi:hypothetical protein